MTSPVRSLLLLLILGLAGSANSFTYADEGRNHRGAELGGRVVGLPAPVHRCHVVVVSAATNTIVADVATDSRLRFEVTLKPGTYYLTPVPVNDSLLIIPPGAGVTVTLGKKDVEHFSLLYSPVPH